MKQRELDHGRSEAFAAQMVGVLNQAAIALMTRDLFNNYYVARKVGG